MTYNQLVPDLLFSKSMSDMPIYTPASSVQRELSIRSESIQRIYNFYVSNLFYVNRRYQRKLVWTIEEKRTFIDSILKSFPVPIILLAETKRDKIDVFEIIDGMQRLNAIVAFIEGEFDIEGKYFDLETMVESKSRLDQDLLIQKNLSLKEVCVKFWQVIFCRFQFIRSMTKRR